MKEELSILLEKYYQGETSLEEEKIIRDELSGLNAQDSLGDVFAYYDSAGQVPAEMLEDIFAGLDKQERKRSLPTWLYTATAAAASVILFMMAWGSHQDKLNREQQFALMENALVSVSEGLQPVEEEQEMLVLWVDENVEIIIN